MPSKRDTFIRYRDTKDPKLAEQILRENQPLVRMMVGRFLAAWQVPIPVEDLEQECAWGMLRALQSFDPDKGRFSTWACEWMRKGLQTQARGSGYVRRNNVPAALLAEIRIFRERHGREPEPRDLMIPVINGKLDPGAIKRALEPLPWFTSFDATTYSGDDETDTLHDVMPDVRQTDPLTKMAIARAMGKLSKQIRDIFLAFADGESIYKIARSRRMTEGQVADAIAKARRTILDELPEGC